MSKDYQEWVDGIYFYGEYISEPDDDLPPIITVTTIRAGGSQDLMLVIDPRVIQEIEAKILRNHEDDITI
jgi:hypothetical protein